MRSPVSLVVLRLIKSQSTLLKKCFYEVSWFNPPHLKHFFLRHGGFRESY